MASGVIDCSVLYYGHYGNQDIGIVVLSPSKVGIEIGLEEGTEHSETDLLEGILRNAVGPVVVIWVIRVRTVIFRMLGRLEHCMLGSVVSVFLGVHLLLMASG